MTVPSSIDSTLARLHDAMSACVARGDLPGVVWGVHHRGRSHVEAIGTTRVGGGAAMRRDTLFRISSMTKQIAAVAALRLVEEGRLELDAPVDRLLPELAHRRVLVRVDGSLDDTVAAHRAITLRDLLTFRLGFGLIWGPQDGTPIQRAANALQLGAFGPPHPSQPPPPDEWMRRFATLPLMDQPGVRWRYNTGAEILGVLLARAANEPLPSLLRSRVFEPLGMNDTSFFVAPAQIDRLATSYVVDPQSGALSVYDEAKGGEWSRPPAFPSAAAGLVSTIDDVLTFARAMLAGGTLDGARLLSEKTVEAMTTDQIGAEQKARSRDALDPDFWNRHGWGLGVATRVGEPHASGYGWDGGLGTSWWSFPARDLAAVLLTQRGEFPLHSEVYRAFWSALT